MNAHLDGPHTPPLRLTPADFVASGGEGTVYAQGDVAFKIFTDPAQAPDRAALAELSALRHPRIVGPDRLLTDDQGQPVGFTMRFLDGVHPLCRLFTRTFRERHGIGPDRVLSLVRQLAEVVAHVHRAGFLIVDLSEVNVLVSADFSAVHLIDVTSWQTPTRPATAVTDSIRDRHATGFDEGTDWFAFAVLAFQLWIGIHPYRGLHPSLKTLDERMRADVSAMRPEVTVPRMCWPLDSIPSRWRRWLSEVLDSGARTPPPAGDHDAMTWVPEVLCGTTVGLKMEEVFGLSTGVRLFADRGGHRVAVTADAVHVDGRLTLRQAGIEAIAFSPRAHQPVVAWREGAALRLAHAITGQPIAISLNADDIATAGSRLVVRRLDNLVELALHDLTVTPGTTGRVLATPQVLAQVPRHATRLFDGIAVFRPLGATWLGLLPRPGACVQVRVPELDGHRIVDARFERGVAVLTARVAPGWKTFVLRFDGPRYDLRVLDDATAGAANLTVTDAGVAVRLTGDEALELFRPLPSDPGLRRVEDDGLSGAMRLVRLDGGLGVLRGSRVYRLSMR